MPHAELHPWLSSHSPQKHSQAAMLYPGLDDDKINAADSLFFSESPLLPLSLHPFALSPSFPFSLELQGWEVLQGLEERAPTTRPLVMLTFFVSPGAMRCHVATSCHVVWLFVLISGCWGKFNPFPHTRHGKPGCRVWGWRWGWHSGQELGGGCSGTPEIPPCCVTGYTLPSLGLGCSAALTGLKIPTPRA